MNLELLTKKKCFFWAFSFTIVCKSFNILVCLPAGKRKTPAGAGFSGEPQVLVSADTPKNLFSGKKSQFFKHFGVLMVNKAPNKHLFSRLLKKAVSMALWTKASLCVKSSLLELSLPRTPSRQIRSLPTYQVGPCNPCNPWLIKDLRENKGLYNCRETFTDVMSALQIKLFMQNKAKFRKSQMNVNKVLTKDYEKKTLGERGKKQSQTNPNKANTNPIQTQSKPIKANTNPIQSQTNPISPPLKAVERQYFLTAFTDYPMIGIIAGVNADVAQW